VGEEQVADGPSVPRSPIVQGFEDRPRARTHHEEITGDARTSIPVGVGYASWPEHGAAGIGLDLTIAEPDAEPAFEDIPGLVLIEVNVWRGNRLGATSAVVRPVGEYEGALSTWREHVACQGPRDELVDVEFHPATVSKRVQRPARRAALTGGVVPLTNSQRREMGQGISKRSLIGW
jgi:hypothetical protein